MKSFTLLIEELNEGMGHCSEYGNSHLVSRQHIASAHTASNKGRSSGQYPSLGAVSSAASKVHNAFAFCRQGHPGRFGSDHALKVEATHQIGLQELGFNNGSGHLQNGLIAEKDRTFGQGMDVATEAEIFQVVKKSAVDGFEEVQLLEILQGRFRKADVLDEMKSLLETCSHEKTSGLRKPPCEELKSASIRHATGFKVSRGHGQFIQIGVDPQSLLGGKKRVEFHDDPKTRSNIVSMCWSVF